MSNEQETNKDSFGENTQLHTYNLKIIKINIIFQKTKMKSEQELTALLCPFNVLISFHDKVFKIFNVLSLEQVTRIDPSFENTQSNI